MSLLPTASVSPVSTSGFGYPVNPGGVTTGGLATRVVVAV